MEMGEKKWKFDMMMKLKEMLTEVITVHPPAYVMMEINKKQNYSETPK